VRNVAFPVSIMRLSPYGLCSARPMDRVADTREICG
jgi:hypothetical protein